MGDNPRTTSTIKPIHEALFSLNLGFAIVASLFVPDPRVFTSALFRLDSAINHALHIRQTDYATGYFPFFLSATAVAFCVWIVLRRADSQFTAWILYSAGGIAALTAAPIFWIIGTYVNSGRYGWTPLHAAEFYELLVATLCTCLYLSGHRRLPAWVGVCLILLHNGFWIRELPPSLTFMGYYLVASFFMLASSVTWCVFIAQSASRRIVRV